VAAAACSRCGSPLKPGIKFCGSCGQPVGEAALWAAPVTAQPQPVEVAAPSAQVTASRRRGAKPTPTPTPRRSGSRLGRAARGCGLVIIVMLVALVGLYFAFRSGIITQAKLFKLVGLGPGTITAMNFRDDAIQTTVTPIKSSQDSEPVGRVYSLDAYEITSLQIRDAGKYRIEIQIQNTGEIQGSCVLNVRGGDEYSFVSLPNGILLMRENSPSSDPKDLFPETSAFCR
jgi:hypothetical protein